jgi:hypothetical protein
VPLPYTMAVVVIERDQVERTSSPSCPIGVRPPPHDVGRQKGLRFGLPVIREGLVGMESQIACAMPTSRYRSGTSRG